MRLKALGDSFNINWLTFNQADEKYCEDDGAILIEGLSILHLPFNLPREILEPKELMMRAEVWLVGSMPEIGWSMHTHPRVVIIPSPIEQQAKMVVIQIMSYMMEI